MLSGQIADALITVFAGELVGTVNVSCHVIIHVHSLVFSIHL